MVALQERAMHTESTTYRIESATLVPRALKGDAKCRECFQLPRGTASGGGHFWTATQLCECAAGEEK